MALPAPYAERPSWTRYRDLIAEDFGVRITRTPRESWRPWRGHTLHLDDWLPEGPPRGTVVLVHGGGGNGRMLAPFGDALSGIGHRCLAPDLPGYGITVTRPGWQPDYAEWPELVATLADEAAAAGPVALFGLSMGGLTSLWAAQRSGRVRAVIASTLLDLRRPDTFDASARFRWLGALTRAGFRALPRLTDRIALPLRLATPLERLTTSPRLQRYFLDDPLIGRRRLAARFFRTSHQYRAPRPDLALPCPLLLVHPGADAWTPTAMSLPVFEAVPTPKRFRELSTGAHLPLEPPAFDECRETVRAFLAETLG